MSLYLDGIFEGNTSSPNKIIISSGGSTIIQGLLTSEISVSTGNKWGPIFDDVSTLSEISSLVGSADMFSWIGASVQCWKGTDPLKFNADFYLINYKSSQDFEGQLRELTKLTALSKTDEGMGQGITVNVHNKYHAEILRDNTSMFNGLTYKDLQNDGNNSDASSTLNSSGQNLFNSSDEEGTVTVSIGNKLTVRNLLVGRVEVTPSLVEVVGQKPLYYRVSASFTGTKPLLSTAVDELYK